METDCAVIETVTASQEAIPPLSTTLEDKARWGRTPTGPEDKEGDPKSGLFPGGWLKEGGPGLEKGLFGGMPSRRLRARAASPGSYHRVATGAVVSGAGD